MRDCEAVVFWKLLMCIVVVDFKKISKTFEWDFGGVENGGGFRGNGGVGGWFLIVPMDSVAVLW